MIASAQQYEGISEHVVARLVEAAYHVVLRRERLANFVDVQLGLWAALSATLERESYAPVREDDLNANLRRTIIESTHDDNGDLEIKGS